MVKLILITLVEDRYRFTCGRKFRVQPFLACGLRCGQSKKLELQTEPEPRKFYHFWRAPLRLEEFLNLSVSDALQQILKTLVVAESVEARVNFEREEGGRAILVSLVQFGKCLVFLVECRVEIRSCEQVQIG